MIAVIADDFTGAAEIGGVGLRRGFKVVIDSKVDRNVETDILVIATDTRSHNPEQAAGIIKKVTRDLLTLQPDFIYKKTDSILRGNVGEELLTQLRVSGKDRVLLVPANPALKRTIRDGIYYYNDVPLNEFNFTNGAVKKRTSSRVLDLLGDSEGARTAVLSTDETLPEKGLVIGNTSSSADLDRWAEKMDTKTIPSGGSEFFDAILRSLKGSAPYGIGVAQPGKSALYVCGSAFANSRALVRMAKEVGQAVIYMPAKFFCSKEEEKMRGEEWAAAVTGALDSGKRVIVAIDRLDCGNDDHLPARIREAIADLVENVLGRTRVDELFIEGGSTSFSIIRRLGYTRFYPVQEFGPGAIRMRIEEKKDMYLTLKPGSYPWPESIWDYSSDRRLK